MASDRTGILRTLALATLDELNAGWEGLPAKPPVNVVRPPEVGLVMAQGRIGGDGAPFNLGEVTVCRSMVSLASGEVGIGMVLGRDRERSLLVACFDALSQSLEHRDAVEAWALGPMRRRQQDADRVSREETEATRVNFFTLVRGED